MGTYAKSVGPITSVMNVTFEAQGTITKGNLVKLGTAQYQATAEDTANDVNCIGVAIKSVNDGANLPVQFLGLATVKAEGTAIAAGDYLKSATSDPTRVISVTKYVSQNIVGRSFAASQTTGDSLVMQVMSIPGAVVS